MPIARRVLLAVPALLSAAPAARAQGWPTRPVAVVVPWAAGGSTDFLARVLAQRLGADLGQPFVVENRPGATGTVGHAHVARARPDGYTLLVAADGTYAMAPHLYDTLPYDNAKAFAPVGILARTPKFLCANPRLVPGDLAAFVDAARAAPGRIAYSSSGVGSSAHLAGELFALTAGVELLHVPYRGGGPAAQAVVAGDVAMGPMDAPTALPLMRGGAVKALAVGAASRSRHAPDVPTAAEALPALAGYAVASEFAMLAPAGTPPAILERLAAAVRQALAADDVVDQLDQGGMEIIAGPPEAWPDYLVGELAKWRDVIRARGIRAG